MAITINGTTGIAGVDGSASTPAVQGTDTNTGIFYPAADTIAFAEGGAEVARFDSSGRLGIGLTSLSSSLDIAQGNGQIRLREGGATKWAMIESSNGRLFLHSDQGNTEANSDMRFYVDNTERARFDVDGNLLVGTTSAVGGATRAGFYNTGSGSAVVGIQNARNVSGDVVNSWLIGSNANNTSSYFVQAGVSGVANVFYIFGNGNVQNTNNSYGAISDVKLKENIVDATPKLADLMQVRVRNYNLKTNPDQKQIGVIAQELENIFPSLIDESPDKDSEGNELGTTTKAVKYSVFVPMLIKAIQELKAELDTTKARLAALEAK
jgi:hypothetical protein